MEYVLYFTTLQWLKRWWFMGNVYQADNVCDRRWSSREADNIEFVSQVVQLSAGSMTGVD